MSVGAVHTGDMDVKELLANKRMAISHRAIGIELGRWT